MAGSNGLSARFAPWSRGTRPLHSEGNRGCRECHWLATLRRSRSLAVCRTDYWLLPGRARATAYLADLLAWGYRPARNGARRRREIHDQAAFWGEDPPRRQRSAADRGRNYGRERNRAAQQRSVRCPAAGL